MGIKLGLVLAVLSALGMAAVAPVAPGGTGWRLVVHDRFESGGVPAHWSRYDGPYGSGAENCARPDHAFVRNGRMHMVLRHRDRGRCGPGWYSAGMMLAQRFQSVDQKVAVRFRVVPRRGVTGHRVIPMRWPSSGDWPAGGEEDFCEAGRLSGCSTFLHSSDDRVSHRYDVDLTRWHTMVFTRRNFTVRAVIDGRQAWFYRGSPRTLPATLKRVVLQQECSHDGCPRGVRGREVIQIEWVKVWNPR